MANKNKYTAQIFIEAIKDSGGIIATICTRVGCDYKTAKKYIAEFQTVADAFEAECEKTDDIAESILINNLKLTYRQQSRGDVVDTSDARWWIERRRRDKFATRQEQEHTGAGGGPIVVVNWDSVDNDTSTD